MDDLKKAAAARAFDFVRPGMRLGLGTGSTAAHFVALLGERVAAGLDVVAVPTSEATARQAVACGIRLTTLDDMPELDLAVDGADEVDRHRFLIKGGGGALLREKIVAASARRMVVIVDASKEVATLGRFPLPVEVAPFGLASTLRRVERAAAQAGCAGPIALRQADGHPFVTDGGHWILDCAWGTIPDARRLAAALSATPGVLEHGLFLDLASVVIAARSDGVAVIGTLD